MGIPIILITFIGTLFIYNIIANYIEQKDEKKIETFLDSCKENTIVSSSKLKEIELLDIDLSTTSFISGNEDTIKIYNKLVELSYQKMTNFKGISNDELKKTYGVNNFNEVLSYQENYDEFLKLIVEVGEKLYNENNYKCAVSILEIGISLDTDITKNYTLLADSYDKQKMKNKLFKLIDKVLQNKNVSQEKIINYISSLKQKQKENV